MAGQEPVEPGRSAPHDGDISLRIRSRTSSRALEVALAAKLSVRDLDVEGLRVFCRVDSNVPLENGRVGDDRRIAASLPTLRLLLERGSRVVLASHLGRPKGKSVPGMSLAPVARRLGEMMSQEIQ